MDDTLDSIILRKELCLNVRRILADRDIYPQNLTFEEYRMDLVDGMAMDMRAYFLGVPEKANHDHRLVPLDWWQHFKDRWFPKWAKRRWPVQHEKIEWTTNVYRICPHLNIETGNARHIEWMTDRSAPPSTP